MIEKIRYVIRNKDNGHYLAKEGEYYSSGELCENIERAEFWMCWGDAELHRSDWLDCPLLQFR